MQVRYVDEYGAGLYWGQTPQPIAPTVGDTVIIEDEEYRVKSKTFIPEKDIVIIEVTQNQVRSKSEDESAGRLQEMQRAIIDIGKRQDASEKKNRVITEQVVSLRKYLSNNERKKE